MLLKIVRCGRWSHDPLVEVEGNNKYHSPERDTSSHHFARRCSGRSGIILYWHQQAGFPTMWRRRTAISVRVCRGSLVDVDIMDLGKGIEYSIWQLSVRQLDYWDVNARKETILFYL